MYISERLAIRSGGSLGGRGFISAPVLRVAPARSLIDLRDHVLYCRNSHRAMLTMRMADAVGGGDRLSDPSAGFRPGIYLLFAFGLHHIRGRRLNEP
jgi:hypothetical protein